MSENHRARKISLSTHFLTGQYSLSAVVSVIALYIVKAIMGLRPTEAEEREGLDITSHGERAYN